MSQNECPKFKHRRLKILVPCNNANVGHRSSASGTTILPYYSSTVRVSPNFMKSLSVT